jgi:prepilin-type N-terminal cleavage/methylation domain-containing protein
MIQRMTEKRKDRGQKGFTLIELLVVIVILGILAAVVVFAVGGVGDKGNESACTIDTRTLRTSLEANFAQNGDYTVTPANGAPDASRVATPAGTEANETTLVTRGFLSETSDLHYAIVYDADPGTGVQPAVSIYVEDGDSPGNDCGTANAKVTGAPGDLNR